MPPLLTSFTISSQSWNINCLILHRAINHSLPPSSHRPFFTTNPYHSLPLLLNRATISHPLHYSFPFLSPSLQNSPCSSRQATWKSSIHTRSSISSNFFPFSYSLSLHSSPGMNKNFFFSFRIRTEKEKPWFPEWNFVVLVAVSSPFWAMEHAMNWNSD